MNRTRKPRVAIVAASLDIVGGQEIQARSLIDALQNDGYPVRLMAVNPRFPPGLGWIRDIRYARTVVNQLFYLPALARLASADVVHVFSGSYWSFLLAPVPAMLVARTMKKRVVLHYHSGEAADHLSNWGPLVHPWLRLAHEIVVPSNYLSTVFERHGYNTRVVRNVVDLTRFEYRERMKLRPRFVCTRNLEPYYRVDRVVEAFAKFRREVPAATLTVAGTGTEERRIRQIAEPLGNSVRFTGRIAPADMPRLLSDHDVFVNASVLDNQPVSILEAFASGLAVISTTAGDIPFMTQHGDAGLLVPPGESGSLLDAMLTVWRRPAEARDRAARARSDVAKYTWPAVREQWAALYAGPALLDEPSAVETAPSTSHVPGY